MAQKITNILQRIYRVCFPEEWPRPVYSTKENEPIFIFIFTPPYSGSTVLAKILNSSSSSMLLHRKGEGQWLIPGLSRFDRWDPEKFVDWESVKAVWMSKVRSIEQLVGKIEFVIEKSPPNIVRAEALLKQFPNHELIAINRNPFANCSSILHRWHNPSTKSEDERKSILKRIANDWVVRSKVIQNLVEVHSPIYFSYEEFCRDTGHWVTKLVERIPELEGISPSLTFQIKDYPPQRISNQNKRQIAKLSDKELEVIGIYLRDYEELLNYFGYTSAWWKPIDEGGSKL